MKKEFAFILLSLFLATGFVSSCGDDEEPTPETPSQPKHPQDSTEITPKDSAEITPVDSNDVAPVDTTEVLPSYALIEGWTSATHIPPEGGRQFFVDFYSPGEIAIVNVSKDDAGRLTLSYSSTAWGKAEFKTLEIKAGEDGGYLLPDGVKTTIVMERGAMGQQGGGGEYELTLVEGSIDKELKKILLVMSAFMNPNHGSYELTFHEGDAPAPVVQ